MADSPIERAARAAMQALIDDPETDAWMDSDDNPDSFAIDGVIRLTPVVRAVIAAIREPSEAMIRDGSDEGDEDAEYNEEFLAEMRAECALIWQAMIDALLEEGEVSEMTFNRFFTIAERCLELIGHPNRDVRHTAHERLKDARRQLDETPPEKR